MRLVLDAWTVPLQKKAALRIQCGAKVLQIHLELWSEKVQVETKPNRVVLSLGRLGRLWMLSYSMPGY